MATIGGWNGWEIRAETTGKTSNSVSFNVWIYAGQNKVCNWSARTLTVSCSNGTSQSGTINAMRFTGPGNSNILSFTFGGLAGNTNYTFTVTYPIRATLDGQWQESWSGSFSEVTGYSFNLNILNPDGTEPYQTGEAGSVEQSVSGGAYARIFNEQSSTYAVGAVINYRNFTPGTGRKLSSVSGVTPTNTTGPWSVTMNGNKVVTFQTAWQTYTISYAPNGGSSTPAAQTKTYNQALALRAAISRNNSTGNGYVTTFNGNGGTYTGSSTLTATNTYSYSFAGWKSSASGTVYGGGANFTENNAATMTAQWNTTTSRGSITLPAASTVSRTGYTFKGWNTNSGATTGSTGTYTPTSSATMYAIWQLNAPSAATATLHYAARDRLSINLGYTGAALTGYTLYYRVNGSTAAYSSMSVGTATNGIITNLQPNTTYQIYVRATNAAGSKDSAVITAKTISDLPSRVSTISTAVSHNSISAEVGGTGDTNDAIQSYSLYCIKASSVPVYNMPIKEFDGKLWLRIFYHNNRCGTVMFTSLGECRNINTVDRYSNLGLLDSGDTYKINGKYEFMLEYPVEFPGQYNRWKQTNAPQNEFNTKTTTGTTVAGYEAIHIDWTQNFWGGLERNIGDASAFSSTWLSGSVGHQNWFYAIGTNTVWKDGIPGWTNDRPVTSAAELWVRIPDRSVSKINSNAGTFTGLQEETTYIIFGSAKNTAGTSYSPGYPVTTLADQAKIYRKNNGTWEKGKAYYKKDGEWKKAKKVYIKVNGEWKVNNNGGS